MRLDDNCRDLRCIAVGIALAQSVDDFEGWMRTIDDKTQSVQRNIAVTPPMLSIFLKRPRRKPPK